MRKKVFLFLLVPFMIWANETLAFPRTPEGFGLKGYSLKNDSLGEINFYVTSRKIRESKPLLLLFDGSGNLPIYSLIRKNDGSAQLSCNIPFDYNSLSELFHVVLISKPGVPFLDSLNVDSQRQFSRKYAPSESYKELLSLDWRVSSASLIIDYLTSELYVKDNDVIAVGISEGGHVVPKLALLNKKVTRIVNIVGGGLSQFFGFIVNERNKAKEGLITCDEAQKNIDNLFLRFEDIIHNPNDIEKSWFGHTYRRWASFGSDIPLENMLKLDIPILLIGCGDDESSPVLVLDYVKIAFVIAGKNNLDYRVYPNCDHSFFDHESQTSKLTDMIQYVTDWIRNSNR